MPELPEVETTMRGILPFVENQRIHHIVVRRRDLRFGVTPELEQKLAGAMIQTLERRGKYILLHTEQGGLIIHLGMSGSLRIIQPNFSQPLDKHDHYDIHIGSPEHVLRYRDPRRFGCLIYVADSPHTHPLISKLGVEPLSDAFDGAYLFARSRKRQVAVKALIMNAQIVVGVGNIYASEALFDAKIHPLAKAGEVSLAAYKRLAQSIKIILKQSISQGGTTLKDFVNSKGEAGYFAQELAVYGRAEAPCPNCQTPIKQLSITQRASYFCPKCQK